LNIKGLWLLSVVVFPYRFFTHCPNGASLDFDAALGVGPFLDAAIFDEGFGLHGFLA
jgi:hypothetical protein